MRGERSVALLEKVGQFAAGVASPDITYEARLLDFANIGLSALWLYAANSEDRFFPIVSDPIEQSAETLVAEARVRAARHLGTAELGGSEELPPSGEPSARPTVERGPCFQSILQRTCAALARGSFL
jgi:hypothetical protein